MEGRDRATEGEREEGGRWRECFAYKNIKHTRHNILNPWNEILALKCL